MKSALLGLITLLCGGALPAQTPEPEGGKVLETFQWHQHPDSSAIYQYGQNTILTVVSHQAEPHDIILRTIGPAVTSRITTDHIAIVGKLSYSEVAPGSFLSISFYREGVPGAVSIAREESANLSGTVEETTFSIRCDGPTAREQKLNQLTLDLHLAGPGTVKLYDVQLVQFPDSTPSPFFRVPGPAPDPSAGKSMYRFGWPDWFADQPHPSMEVDPQTGSLFLKYWGEKPVDLELQRVELNVLSTLETNQFAVEGHLQYKKVAPGSYLEMWTIFEPEKPGDPPPAYCTRTLADSGPLQALSGDSESRAFQIPFDITGAKTHLKRVLVRLHLAGGFGTTLSIDDANISQFPNGTFPATVASLKTVTPTSPPLLASFNPTSSSPSPALATSRGMVDGRSFLLGAAATSLALLIFFALVYLFRRLRRRHHERELRRIASLDT